MVFVGDISNLLLGLLNPWKKLGGTTLYQQLTMKSSEIPIVSRPSKSWAWEIPLNGCRIAPGRPEFIAILNRGWAGHGNSYMKNQIDSHIFSKTKQCIELQEV